MTMADPAAVHQQPETESETLQTDAADDTVVELQDTAPDSAAEERASTEQELLLMKDQLLRALADNENLRKRAARELEDSNKYAITSFARDIVGVTENLHRALHSIPADAQQTDPNYKILVEGIEMTLSELTNSMARQGIRRIDPAGEKFDHNFHQAVAQVESADVPSGFIIQVLQAGYVIHDRLLRPAMVAVSKGAANAPQAGIDTQA